MMIEPTHATDVMPIKFELLEWLMDRPDLGDTKRLIRDTLRHGYVWIIKGVFTRAECDQMIAEVETWAAEREPSFHKMHEGCVDFHRVIDRAASDAYSVTSVRHGFYFHRFNSHPIWHRVARLWRVFELLAGIPPGSFAKNTPKDGTIERLIFYKYENGGMLGRHADPVNHHAIVVGGTLSERGVDFSAGGLYAIGSDGQQIDLEPHMRAGDFMLCYPKVSHGVAPIVTTSARWFMGLAIVDSDHVEHRVTAERVHE